MAEALSMDAIKNYLIKVGCKIEYPILVNAFKQHLYNPDAQLQGKIRTQFKDYVNRVATVSLENNMKFISLRPEFRPSDLTDGGMNGHMQIPYNQPPQLPVSSKVHVKQNPQLPPPKPRQNQQSPKPVPNQLFQNHALARTPAESLQDDSNRLMSLTSQKANLELRNPQQHQHYRSESDNSARSSMIMPPPPPPPRPPPRRRSLLIPSPIKQTVDESREIQNIDKRGLGRVKEHALKLNSSVSSSDLNALIPLRNSNNSMKENRLSRDLVGISSALQRNGSHLTNRSRSSHREDESDSSSLQPTDPLRRRWAVEASNCNYNGLVALLKEDPKLSTHKDIINGYTALHWAAKFGNLDIIKLIAGTHNVSVDIKSSAGYTPLHIAYIFDFPEVAELLLKSYNANPNIRDHSGKRPKQYSQQR